ncbi:MBL fold metallo-hydrolase [Nocardioides kongjuensis]|uniref:L-ascorbate metabolism protein UlaG (Beta-lactamase superfamily) n=1 Tax=Nocardioides kongjuensis TaxID=349522 RepID=A0A852RT08_9ACTN|nr:MBL fold metallo-hydrolase [Nocardioides albidus]NYD32010.1 L-ascorbate metabolism protein UlaG (beta-lactamase superfamily) [Nocardioides kongjuensis]
MHLTYTLVGGATNVIDYAGLRILVDPTFDAPKTYHHDGVELVRTTTPAIAASDIGAVDLVLITHDHHIDHLDAAGRAVALAVATVVTTTDGAGRLGGEVNGLAEFESMQVPLPGGGAMTITGLPAQHGPEPLCQVMGQVLGFLLEAPGAPTVYLTGDNYSLDVSKEVAARIAPVDVVVMYGGGACFDGVNDGEMITMPNDGMVEVARLVEAKRIVPCHTEGWRHFTEGADSMQAAFEAAGLGDRFLPVRPGETISVTV